MKTKVYPDWDITDRLNKVLTQEGWNDSRWGRILKVSRKTVFAWRHGASSPTVVHLAVICDELNISADSIIYGDEPREEEVV
jgi:transcriptional regulator with XRE-family HTH domain